MTIDTFKETFAGCEFEGMRWDGDLALMKNFVRTAPDNYGPLTATIDPSCKRGVLQITTIGVGGGIQYCNLGQWVIVWGDLRQYFNVVDDQTVAHYVVAKGATP